MSSMRDLFGFVSPGKNSRVQNAATYKKNVAWLEGWYKKRGFMVVHNMLYVSRKVSKENRNSFNDNSFKEHSGGKRKHNS